MKFHFLAILLVLLVDAAYAATNAIDANCLAYNLKTTVEAYEKVGLKNPKWDEAAKKSLNIFARIRSWTNGLPNELIPELQTNLTCAMKNGCTDPMIRYLNLRFVENQPGTNAAIAFSDVSSALQQSQYPDIRKYYATMWARRTWYHSGQKPSEIVSELTTSASNLANALKDKSITLREADQACDFLIADPWAPYLAKWNCYQTIEAPLISGFNGSCPFLLTKARAYIAYAWNARGNSYADKVSAAGWRLFAERLEIAAEALETAWAQDPHDVRICVEMLTVELGQGVGRERLEKWFQRGMKIDPTNYELCSSKMQYLRPRWYGSIEDMIAFGRECTMNTNYSGGIRLMLVDAYNDAFQEVQDKAERAEYWKQPRVWRDVQFTFEQFFKLYPDAVGYRHNYAFYANRCGQYQEFLNQIKLFPSTNYAYFGGIEKFNAMVKSAERRAKLQ